MGSLLRMKLMGWNDVFGFGSRGLRALHDERRDRAQDELARDIVGAILEIVDLKVDRLLLRDCRQFGLYALLIADDGLIVDPEQFGRGGVLLDEVDEIERLLVAIPEEG